MKHIRLILVACSFMLLTTCATYQQSVAARSVGVQGQTDGQSAGGKIIYRVEYR